MSLVVTVLEHPDWTTCLVAKGGPDGFRDVDELDASLKEQVRMSTS